jgi:hypothetical protein
MILGLIIWLVTLLISMLVIGRVQQRHPKLDRKFMIVLFFYHSLLAVTYYLYARFNPSDSNHYHEKAVFKFFGDNWFDYFGTSTKFIDFISYSLVNHLGFTYEAEMAFFSWLGFLGFLFFYIFFKERIVTAPRFFGMDSLWIVFLLPNLHFWSSSLGKGSIIFLGFGLFFFSLKYPARRIWAILLGGFIIYMIRPHIFLVIMIAIGLSYTFSTKGVATGYRIAILLAAVGALFFVYQDVLQMTGLEDESIADPLISHRAQELSKATSGIDLVNYSIPEKLFAFWFRPLFFDAPGMLGYIVSFENLFYLIFFARLLSLSGIKFIWSGDAIAKTCLLTFFGVSFALAQISGNLGLAMRQKSQVMILMLFVIVKYMDDQRLLQMRAVWMKRKAQARLKAEIGTKATSLFLKQ